MIIGWLVSAVLACISALLSLFPSVSLPVTAAGDVGQLAYTVNQFVPLADVAGAALAVLAVKVLMNVWNFVLFVYHQFWGSD